MVYVWHVAAIAKHAEDTHPSASPATMDTTMLASWTSV